MALSMLKSFSSISAFTRRRVFQSVIIGMDLRKNNMCTNVDRVFVATFVLPDLAQRLRKALEANGDGDKIKVEELSIIGKNGDASWTEESMRKFPQVEYLMSDPDLIGKLFCHPDCQLKWAQSSGAGCELVFKELKKTEKKPNFIMTRRDAGFLQMMSEYVIGEIITRERNFSTMEDLQKQSKFCKEAVRDYRLLNTLTVGILGLGTLGSDVARVCKALNMTVLGVVRDERYMAGETTHEHVQHIRPLSQLPAMLELCDYVVNILPSTPQTTNLLSGDTLKPCQKKKSVLINVGRGSVIDDASLVHAVKSGWLGGAILDVFNEEPLPPSSELWTLPGVTITPHVSAISTHDLATDNFIENLNASREGKPMKLVVDFDKGY